MSEFFIFIGLAIGVVFIPIAIWLTHKSYTLGWNNIEERRQKSRYYGFSLLSFGIYIIIIFISSYTMIVNLLFNGLAGLLNGEVPTPVLPFVDMMLLLFPLLVLFGIFKMLMRFFSSAIGKHVVDGFLKKDGNAEVTD